MIYLTLKDPERTRFAINHRLIERIDELATTIVILQSGKKYIVDETTDEIVEKIIEFESKVIERVHNKEETVNGEGK